MARWSDRYTNPWTDLSTPPSGERWFHIPRSTGRYYYKHSRCRRGADETTLRAALTHVARHLTNRNQHAHIVVVGGAVNVMNLRTRLTTHDVDIFGSDFTNWQRGIVDEAMESAQRTIPGLERDWLNTKTQTFMPASLHQELTMGAYAQNVQIFDAVGLTVYAAPWEYMFTTKISRILSSDKKVPDYHFEDALTYLHEYVRSHENGSVHIETVLDWAQHYERKSDMEFLLGTVKEKYHALYGCNAFI